MAIEIQMRKRAAIFFFIVVVPAMMGCKTLGAQLHKYGYNELRPPSTLLPPGTMITVLAKHPLQAGIVCTQEAAFGPDLELQEGDSATNEVAQKTSGEFKIDADYLKEIKANAKYQYVRSVKLKLANVKIYELSDDEVFKRIGSRSEECVKAIEFRNKRKQPISMVKSVIGADVEYIVDFEASAGLDAAAKQDVIKDLAIQFKADVSTATQSTVKGTALYWGVRDDFLLATIDRDGMFKVVTEKLTREDIAKRLKIERLLPVESAVISITDDKL